MNITPVIPDGYNGPIKQLTCRICKHIFYLTMADYRRLGNVSYCHECSLILMGVLERTQGRRGSIFSKQELVSPPPPPLPRLEPELVSPQPSVRVPQPRTLDREKMTIEQLLEEAKMLDKTWRY